MGISTKELVHNGQTITLGSRWRGEGGLGIIRDIFEDDFGGTHGVQLDRGGGVNRIMPVGNLLELYSLIEE